MERRGTKPVRIAERVALAAGDRPEFVVGPDGSHRGDATDDRIRLCAPDREAPCAPEERGRRAGGHRMQCLPGLDGANVSNRLSGCEAHGIGGPARKARVG